MALDESDFNLFKSIRDEISRTAAALEQLANIAFWESEQSPDRHIEITELLGRIERQLKR